MATCKLLDDVAEVERLNNQASPELRQSHHRHVDSLAAKIRELVEAGEVLTDTAQWQNNRIQAIKKWREIVGRGWNE